MGKEMNPRSVSSPNWNSVLLPKSSAEFGVYCATGVKVRKLLRLSPPAWARTFGAESRCRGSQAPKPQFENGSVYRTRWWANLDDRWHHL